MHFDEPLYMTVQINAKVYRWYNILFESVHYNPYRIVCIKSLTEQVRKCCHLPCVFSQHAFFKWECKKPIQPQKGEKNKTTFQGSRSPAYHLVMPAILRWQHVTLPGGTHMPGKKGMVTPSLALICSEVFHFALVWMEETETASIGADQTFSCNSRQFHQCLQEFQKTQQWLFIPTTEDYSSSGC